MKKSLFILLCLFSFYSNCSAGGKDVEIEYIEGLHQWMHEKTCGIHALFFAKLGIEYLNAESPEEESRILRQMKSKQSYYDFAAEAGLNRQELLKISGRTSVEMQEHINAVGLQNDVFVIDASIMHLDNDAAFWSVAESKYMSSLVEDNCTKGFVISNGGRHFISCALKKKDGEVERVLGMNSSRSFTWLKRIFLPKFVGMPDDDAIQVAVDLANRSDLSETLDLAVNYKLCVEMARRISSTMSFDSWQFFFDYSKENHVDLSQELIDSFINEFTSFVKSIPIDDIYSVTLFRYMHDEDDKRQYINRLQLLELFELDSDWWSNNDWISGSWYNTILDNSERIQLRKMLKINELSAESNDEPDNSAEPESVESKDVRSDSPDSMEEAKGE